MFDAITQRQSTRAEYDGRFVSPEDLRALADAVHVDGVELVLLTERRQIDQITDMVVAGNSVQMNDPAFVRELKSWIRFSAREAMSTGDGLFGGASGNPVGPEWLGSLLFDIMFKAAAENDKYVRHMRSSAGVAVFVTERDDKDHWVRAGRACQQFSLLATARGLKHAYVNQPVEVPALRKDLASHLALGERRADLVMRFGYGPAMPYSLRRSSEQLIFNA
jgi:hypothetical protein